MVRFKQAAAGSGDRSAVHWAAAAKQNRPFASEWAEAEGQPLISPETVLLRRFHHSVRENTRIPDLNAYFAEARTSAL